MTDIQTGMSQKFKKNISHPGQEISLHLSNFSKEVSQLTDWQTHKKFVFFGTSVQTSQECVPKMSDNVQSRSGDFSIIS